MDPVPEKRTVNTQIIAALVLGGVTAGLTLSIETAGSLGVVTFCFPGMLGAMVVSNNVHAFHLWVAAVFNFIFYFILTWSLIGLGLRLFKKKVKSSVV